MSKTELKRSQSFIVQGTVWTLLLLAVVVGQTGLVGARSLARQLAQRLACVSQDQLKQLVFG
jgi:hypothetical protein